MNWFQFNNFSFKKFIIYHFKREAQEQEVILESIMFVFGASD